jgi:hypothetical protein
MPKELARLQAEQEGTLEWMARLRMAAMKAVQPEDMEAIFKQIVEKARRGDEKAIRLLMTYLEPPHNPSVNLTQVNVRGGAAKRNGTAVNLENGPHGVG